MKFRDWILALALAANVSAASPATFRWTAQDDAESLDPHAAWIPASRAINLLVYERLFARDKDFAMAPGLAESWENVSPTRWIVHLRKGVRFHDGSDFTADDVVYSFNRAARSDSTVRIYAVGAGTPSKIDDHTVEFATPAPNPLMVEMLRAVPIMSKAWCERHGVSRPQDLKNAEGTFAAQNAMGTGPFVLVSREAGVRTLHRKNPEWWGIAKGLFTGNADVLDFRPLENAATRTAALKSGQVDFVLDPSPQDIPLLREDNGLTVWDGVEQRIVYVGLDLARDELLYSNVKGRNPFKDRRVRFALYEAIDIEAIRRQVMRGDAVPTDVALHVPVGTDVAPGLERLHPYDPAAAKHLLAEAGYGQGFGFTLHCPRERAINGDRICTALAAMWARIGVDVKVEVVPTSIFMGQAIARDVSAYLYSYGGEVSDSLFMLRPVLHSASLPGYGQMNYGSVRIRELDALIEEMGAEMDPARRKRLLAETMKLVQAELPVIPLHRQVSPWVSRNNVTLVHSPDNIPNLTWVRIR
jgi:peptide/nickel transport system substrate-binding protein